MQFNSHSDQLDLVSEIKRICGTDTTSYPLKDMARRCNIALDRFIYLAATANGQWQFDDSNNSTLPIGTTDLISGQQDYSFASDVLLVEKVFCKDTSGVWNELTPVDISDSQTTAKDIWTLAGTTGVPQRYDKVGGSLLLDPIPNYNSTAGLKVVFQRGPSYFASTDTTKTPGIPSIFHSYIARHASLQFLIDNGKPSKNDIAGMIVNDERSLQTYFARRGKDKPARLYVRQENNR